MPLADPFVRQPAGLAVGPDGTYYGRLGDVPHDWTWRESTSEWYLVHPLACTPKIQRFDKDRVVQCRPPLSVEDALGQSAGEGARPPEMIVAALRELGFEIVQVGR